MKTILVPTDFSEQANFALDLARQLAIKHRMELKLFHVVEQGTTPYMTAVSGGMHNQMDNVYVLRLIEKVKAQFQVMISELQKVKVPASYQIRIGNPYKKISSYIKNEACELIIMGTHGTSGMDDLLVGSNTEKVVRYAHCPVITLKDPVRLNDIRSMVFAAGRFDQSDQLFQNLFRIQQLFGAKTHLVTINTPGNFFSDRDGRSSLLEFAEKNQLKDYTVNIYSDLTEEEGIKHFAEDQQADLIVMATHGRTGVGHLLAGSLTEQVVNHSALPVVTFNIGSRKPNPVKDVVL